MGVGESDDRGTTDESRITVFALTFSLSQTDRVRRLFISLAPYRGKRGPQNIHQVRKIGTVSFDPTFPQTFSSPLKHDSLSSFRRTSDAGGGEENFLHSAHGAIYGVSKLFSDRPLLLYVRIRKTQLSPSCKASPFPGQGMGKTQLMKTSAHHTSLSPQ